MLEARATKVNTLFGATLLQNDTAKLIHGVVEATGAKANFKSSTQIHRNKRELYEECVVSINAHFDWDAENVIY